ncbi:MULTISPECIES: hypothetical protein [Haloferacaceae]|uniref:Uncharacterized protein n=1 Tax=Halorubrum glutamatedens TaxID=2707018 RepID=A0ABD5QW30_9EURY|nr:MULTISPECIES: hypothetical protein [Haloferacales]
MCGRDDRPIGADARATIRSDDRVIVVFLLLLSMVVLAVLVYYSVTILEGLPDVLPDLVRPA